MGAYYCEIEGEIDIFLFGVRSCVAVDASRAVDVVHSTSVLCAIRFIFFIFLVIWGRTPVTLGVQVGVSLILVGWVSGDSRRAGGGGAGGPWTDALTP